MYQILLDKVATYDTVIIHRHKEPDMDALGAQFGLKGIILNNYHSKQVYVVGDTNENKLLGHMDTIQDDVYQDALVIIVDVAGTARISDSRFSLAKERIVIDHHQNMTDVDAFFIHDPKQIATCQMLVEMVIKHQLTIDSMTATALLSGLITDSGRFFYPGTSEFTFKAAAFLMEKGADLQGIYESLYQENIQMKKLKAYATMAMAVTDKGVAYLKNDKTLKHQYGVSSFSISRGLVGQMGGIEGIPIWANFTEYDDGSIICELRSKEIPVVDVAKAFGGGGHQLACGCTVSDWETTDKVLNALDALLER